MYDKVEEKMYVPVQEFLVFEVKGKEHQASELLCTYSQDDIKQKNRINLINLLLIIT